MVVGREQAAQRFGALVRRYRRRVGLTQEELAERAGVSPQTVSNLERGVLHRPRKYTVDALVGVFGLTGGERAAFHAAARGTAATAATPRAEVPPATALAPVPPTPLVGRKGELATLLDLLTGDGARIVTITGPGGSGKTRLALALAQALPADQRKRVRFLDLAPLDDPALAPAALARGFGLAVGEAEPLAALVALLRARESLLLLDNADQVVDGLACLATVVAHCPGVQVVVTSRARLNLRGEEIVQLRALAVHEASALFLARARAVRPHLAVDATTVAVVAAICERLDGLPLALELAASWIGLIEPRELLARLDRSLSVLVDGASDLPARQRTMRDTIAWSYNGLAARDQALFRRIAVCHGCTFDSALALLGSAPRDVPEATAGLRRLVERNLVQVRDEGEPRLVMLQTIREYGLEQLVARGEWHTARQRHAGHYLALIESARLPEQRPDAGDWLPRLDRERENLHLALRWLVAAEDPSMLRLGAALAEYWAWYGLLREGRDQLEVIHSLLLAQWPERRDSPDAAWLSLGIGWLALRQGDLARARQALDAALPIFRHWRDDSGTLAALASLAEAVLAQGDVVRAAAFAAECRAVAQGSVEEHWLARAIYLQAQLAWATGDHRACVELLAQTRALPHDRQLAGAITLLSGLNQLSVSDLDAADGALSEAIRTATDRITEPLALAYRALLAARRGAAQEAIASANACLQLLPALQERLPLARCLETLGWQASILQDHQRVARLLGAASALRATSGARLAPVEQQAHDDAISAAEQALGAAAFREHWNRGFAIPLATLLEEAVS